MTPEDKIIYLSKPTGVSMADRWFEIASVDHFWIRRRFAVLKRLAGRLISKSRAIAEVGCGNGLLQRQIEAFYGREVSGFDLNEFALKQNVSQLSSIYCYDILQKWPEFHEKFDLIFLFDVLEHITDEVRFLDALSFHLAPAGHLVINVPAGQWAYSSYDRAAGHVRRYAISNLHDAAEHANFKIVDWTYWGLPLVPAVVLRKIWLGRKREKDEIIRAGFDSRNKSIDRLMRVVAGCEIIPQKLIGTSLLATLQLRRRH